MRRKAVTSKMMKSFIAESLLLLMAEKPFEEITVGEIVKKAGVNRSTYYRHFEKKQDVIFYFLDCVSEDIPKWDKKQKPDFKEHLVDIYEHYYGHKEQMLTIYKNNGLSFLFFDVMKKKLRAKEAKNHTIDTKFNVAFHIGGTFNHFLFWLSRDMTDTPEEMANYTLAVLPKELIEYIWEATNSK